MYNPSLHTATNKPIGITGTPTDARSYYYNTATFAYRPYASTDEVIGYLIGNDRKGQFSVIIGTSEYWFKDGINDGDLVFKSAPAVWGDISGDITDQADLTARVNALVAAALLPIRRPVTAGDAQPKTIMYTVGWVYPEVLFKNLDGTEYGGAGYDDTGTSIVVTGDQGAPGTFADSFLVVVKP